MFSLVGKIALITGAQQGIGAAIAVAMAEEGADVTLTWLDDEPPTRPPSATSRSSQGVSSVGWWTVSGRASSLSW